jgi:hypothetical protein
MSQVCRSLVGLFVIVVATKETPEEKMSKYLLLLSSPKTIDVEGPAFFQEVLSKHLAWSSALRQGGHLLDVDKLRFDGRYSLQTKSEGIVVDGPYTETKEGIGGYYKIKVSSLDEAIALAKACPLLSYGGTVQVIEIDSMDNDV